MQRLYNCRTRLYVLKVCNVPHSTLEEGYQTCTLFACQKCEIYEVNFNSNIIFFWFCVGKELMVTKIKGPDPLKHVIYLEQVFTDRFTYC